MTSSVTICPSRGVPEAVQRASKELREEVGEVEGGGGVGGHGGVSTSRSLARKRSTLSGVWEEIYAHRVEIRGVFPGRRRISRVTSSYHFSMQRNSVLAHLWCANPAARQCIARFWVCLRCASVLLASGRPPPHTPPPTLARPACPPAPRKSGLRPQLPIRPRVPLCSGRTGALTKILPLGQPALEGVLWWAHGLPRQRRISLATPAEKDQSRDPCRMSTREADKSRDCACLPR